MTERETPQINIEQLEKAAKEIHPDSCIDPTTGRVWLPDYSGVGLTVTEAMVSAAQWWEHKARFTMPDYNKNVAHLEKAGMKSGVLQGKPWAMLDRSECLHVMWQWHTHIAVPQIEAGKLIGDIKVVQ